MEVSPANENCHEAARTQRATKKERMPLYKRSEMAECERERGGWPRGTLSAVGSLSEKRQTTRKAERERGQ